MIADRYDADQRRRAAAERPKAAYLADASGPRTGHGRARWTDRIPWPGWRAFRRVFLVKAGTVAALTAVLLAITFELRAWGAGAWLVILPLPVLTGALRRPRHGWLLALEFSLCIWVSALADTAWGPPTAGPSESLLDILINVPISSCFPGRSSRSDAHSARRRSARCGGHRRARWGASAYVIDMMQTIVERHPALS